MENTQVKQPLNSMASKIAQIDAQKRRFCRSLPLPVNRMSCRWPMPWPRVA
jgi:hypothetical protein